VTTGRKSTRKVKLSRALGANPQLMVMVLTCAASISLTKGIKAFAAQGGDFPGKRTIKPLNV